MTLVLDPIQGGPPGHMRSRIHAAWNFHGDQLFWPRCGLRNRQSVQAMALSGVSAANHAELSLDRRRSGRGTGVERSDSPTSPAAPHPAVATVRQGFPGRSFKTKSSGIAPASRSLGVAVSSVTCFSRLASVSPTPPYRAVTLQKVAVPCMCLRHGPQSSN